MCCLPDPDKPPDTKFKKSAPLILGAVCRTWRRIVWATPRLWNVIFFDLWFKGCDTIARKEILAEWLLRSGRRPLHITIGTNQVVPDESAEALLPFIDVLNVYADRWRTLKVYTAFSSILERLRGGGIPLDGCGLSELDLEMHDEEMWPFVINLTPVTSRLCKLRICGVYLNSLEVNYQFLTHLTAEFIDEDDCVEIMRRAPLLIVCEFRGIQEPYDENAPQCVVICHNLQKLVIEDGGTKQLVSFFGRIQLPKLEELTINTNDAHWYMEAKLDLAAFFDLSPCPLQSLTLGSIESDFQDVRKMLRKVPTLKRLSLCARQWTNMAVRDALYALAGRFRPTNLDGHPEPTDLLVPQLESLRCSGNPETFSWDVLPKIFGLNAGNHGHSDIQASLRNVDLILSPRRDCCHGPQHPPSLPASAPRRGQDRD
ncbi:hypothetical protein NLJ89_g8975 [Agrocybe chaxingu]|uniref:F-box domain-containing protein n=1 Tax=Agrocybe chaxingu TaxID=84603 RepID=A0A9W8JUA5_9AGAR|nr:hypothetical protein NLJ89_g8975 [Agrocybe chaxingu]